MLDDVAKRPGLSKAGLVVRLLKRFPKLGELPGIMLLIAYKPEKTKHVSRFIHEVMRGKSELEPWFRELIAAYVSSLNQCRF